jgi:hypothetical protein
MTATMNPPLVTLRLAEPPFQVQVVVRQSVDRANEQPGHEADHQLHEVLRERSLLLGELLLELFKLATSLIQRTLGRLKRVGNRLDLLDVQLHLRLDVFDGLQPTVDACR